MRRHRLLMLVMIVVGLTVTASGGCSSPARANLDFTLKDMNGRDVRLTEFAGKPFVVNFWATWCVPCIAETPMLVGLAAKYAPKGVTIVGISTDDKAPEIRAFAEKFKISYPMLVGFDREDVLKVYGYTGLQPVSVFIKADGTIADRLVGASTEDVWDRKIRALF